MGRKQLFEPRNGTAAAWASANPVLDAGEFGIASDSGVYKLGDGATPWNSLPGFGGAVVTVAEGEGIDPSGATDSTAAIQALINATGSEGGIIWFPLGTYSITTLTLLQNIWLMGAGPSNNPNTQVKFQPVAGIGATNAMLSVTGAFQGQVRISRIELDGTNGGSPYTYGLYFPTEGAFLSDYPILDQVRIYNFPGGTGLFYGGNRGGLVTHDLNIGNCQIGANLGGSDSLHWHPTFASNTEYGFWVQGSMTRIIGMDCFANTVGGRISINDCYLYGFSFDQNQHQGLIVDNVVQANYNVNIEGRFFTNGEAANATYAHLDISAASPGGVIVGPSTTFEGTGDGNLNTVSWDVYTNGVSFYDYSVGISNAANGHTDGPNLVTVAPGSPNSPVTVAAYTFKANDVGQTVAGNSASAQSFTVDKHTTTPYPLGAVIAVRQLGAGQISFAGATGVTLLTSNAAKTRAQYSLVTLSQDPVTLDTWYVDGDT